MAVTDNKYMQSRERPYEILLDDSDTDKLFPLVATVLVEIGDDQEIWQKDARIFAASGHTTIALRQAELFTSGFEDDRNQPNVPDLLEKIRDAIDRVDGTEKAENHTASHHEGSLELMDEHGGVWGEHPDHTVADWISDVSNGETRRGYWDWVANRIEMGNA